MIEIIEKEDTPALQSIALDGVCSDEELKALRVIDVLDLRCRLGLVNGGLVHRNTQVFRLRQRSGTVAGLPDPC